MATDRPSPPEGMDSFSAEQTDESEIETIELDAGEVLEGLLLDVTDGEGEHGDWYRLKVKDDTRGVVHYFAKGDAKSAARQGALEVGERLWIAKDTEEEEFERDDGKTVQYNPVHIAFPEGS